MTLWCFQWFEYEFSRCFASAASLDQHHSRIIRKSRRIRWDSSLNERRNSFRIVSSYVSFFSAVWLQEAVGGRTQSRSTLRRVSICWRASSQELSTTWGSCMETPLIGKARQRPWNHVSMQSSRRWCHNLHRFTNLALSTSWCVNHPGK